MTPSPLHEKASSVLRFLGKSIPGYFFFLFTLHILIILLIGHYKEPRLWENGIIANYVSMGKGFAAGFSIPDELTSWQAPGYPYLIVAFWKFFGRTPTAYLLISLIQAAALSSVFIPLEKLTKTWIHSEAARWIRPLVLLMPLYYWYGTRLHHTALVMAFHPWLIWGWMVCPRLPFSWKHVLLGITTGIAGLFQPVLLGIFGGISGTLLVASVLRRENSTGVRIVAIGVLTLLALLPWTIRNYQVHHRILIIKDSFGKEFWMGNNPHATGTGYALGGEEDIANAYPPKARIHAGMITEIEMMEALQNEAVEYIKAEPLLFMKRTAHKILWFWTMTPPDRVRSHGGGEALIFRWLHAGYWFTFLTLLVVGLFRGVRWKTEYASILIFYIGLYSMVYGLTHVGQARFRGEIEFIFLPAVASGLWVLSKQFTRSSAQT